MAGNVVGQAIIEVRPNLAPFKRAVEQGASSAARSIKPIPVKADTKPAEAGFGRLKSLAIGIAGVFAVSKGVEFFKGSIDAASDLNESLSKNKVVFGDSSREVQRFAKTAASSLGISRQAALEQTATFGNLFTAMKIGKPAAADMSQSIVKLGGDLASFNNVDPQEALEALRSGLVGEVEPLRKFGVNVSAAALQQKAFQLGLIKTEKEALTPAAKAQAAYALILEQTKTAQGDFTRTSSGLANQQRILAANILDLKAKLGTALLPAVLVVVAAFNRLVSFLTANVPKAIDAVRSTLDDLQVQFASQIFQVQLWKNSFLAALPSLQQVIATLREFAPAIAAGVAAFVAFRSVVSVINLVRNSVILLNAVLLANPIVLVGLALAALAAAFVIAYQRSAEFRAIVQTALTQIQVVAAQLVAWVTGTLVPQLVGAFHAIEQTWNQNSAQIAADARKVVEVFQQVWTRIAPVVRAALTSAAAIVRANITIIQNIIQAVLNVLGGRWGAAWQNLKNIARAALQAVVTVISTLGPAMLAAAAALGKAAVSGLQKGLAAAGRAVLTALAKIPGLIATLAGVMLSAGANLGRQFVQGMINGMASLAGGVISKARSLASSAVSAVTGIFDSHSPSRVMATEGRNFVQGFINGVDALAPNLKQKVSAAFKDAAAQARQALLSSSNGLASSVNSFLDARLAKGPAAQALADAQAQQRALDTGQQIAALQTTISNPESTDAERAKASADLNVLMAQQAYDSQQKQVDDAKAANDQKLADLGEALNRGLITQKVYQQKVQALLASQGVTYKAVGDTLGLAFADGFLASVQQTLQQAAAVAKSGLAGLGFGSDVTDPRSVVKDELKDAKSTLADARKSARDKSGPGGAKVTKAEEAQIRHAKQQVDTLTKILAALQAIATTGVPAALNVQAVPGSWLEVAGGTTADAAR